MLHRRSALRSEMNHAIHAALTGRGIELPFPQRDIHIRSAEGLEGLRIGREGAPDGAARKLQRPGLPEEEI